MKQVMKRGLAMVMVLVLCLGVLSGVTVNADAAGSWLYNQGTRGTIASTLSSYAEAFYKDTSYEYLSSLSGSSDLGTVSGSSLYKELQDLMESSQTKVTSYNDTRDMFAYTDCQNGGGKISSFYSGKEIGPAWDSGKTWNREHTWPNSKGDASGQGENDIMMLRPTATSENGSRGNTAYGESAGYYNPNSESGGKYNLHGDVARILLYVYVRWGNTVAMWGSSGVIESKDVLLKWMAEDPVDTWELGRNDSVQSITGTRNVFVDYPELAFLLFNEDVPVDMITPSGKAANSSYTITAVSNNEAYGTVSVNGKVITAVPAAGYYTAGYELTNGTASVTHDGNHFIVRATSDCTVQVNFAPKATTGVFFWENGTVAASQMVYTGDTITLPTHNSAVPQGYTFIGWADSELADTETYPASCMKAGSSYTVTGNTNLYAVYSYTEVSDAASSYVLVENASQLTIGSKVVITAAKSNKALSTTQNSNNRGAVDITKNSDKTISWTTAVQELTLGAGTTSGTYSFHTGSGYLYCASTSSKNYLKTQSSLNAAASFAITVKSDGSCELKSQISGINRNLLQYNSTNNLFACYGSSSNQNPVSLYIETAGGSVTYYTTGAAVTCQHANTSFVEGKAATCTTNGWTDGTYCADCQTYVAGCETLLATGHATAVWMNAVAASCHTYGIAGHWHCDICNANYAEKTPAAQPLSDAVLQLPLNPQNHDADTEVRGACEPTCTVPGYTGDTYCLGCQALVEQGTEIPVIAHTTKAVAEKAPTHEEEGNIAHYLCESCGKFFAEEAATTELPAEQIIIPAQGHEFGEFQKDSAKHWKECSCGVKSEEDEHTFGDWETILAATQTTKGSKERSCSVCGYKEVAEIPVISSPATGDNAQLMLWAVLMLVSACGIVTVVVMKKRQIG